MRKAVLHLQYRRKIRAALLAVCVASSLFASINVVWGQSVTPGGVKLAKPISVLAPSFGSNSVQNVGVPDGATVSDVTENAKAVQNSSRYEAADDIRTAAIIAAGYTWIT